MPPCKLEKGAFKKRPRRDATNDRDPMAPNPVRPRAIQYHELFSIAVARQHLIVDDKWTPASLTEQYARFAELLLHRVMYNRHLVKASRRKLLRENRQLKEQCADGRTKLQKLMVGNNAHCIRNILTHHRGMQRLYQKMPVHLVVDNINQRTFTLRKEKDRLEFILAQRKHEYRELLLDRSELENKVKYANEFIIKEELQSRVLLKRMENSVVRIRAIKTINTTYKKMLQVLLQDEIFYEPILRSLDGDIAEQSQFIKHILYLGMPAISKFKELHLEYKQLEIRSRQNLQSKIEVLAALLKPSHDHTTKVKDDHFPSADPTHYCRRTQSMMLLNSQLRAIEQVIKEVQIEGLCSQAREIFPHFKNKLRTNQVLHRTLEKNFISHHILENKLKYTSMLREVLLNNLSEEEINRVNRIAILKETLQKDQRFEHDTMKHLQNRAVVAVQFRITLWNLLDILRHIDRQPIIIRSKYPNSYLKLPLLKFEMHEMRACAPNIFEEDTTSLMHNVKRKVHKLMKAFKEISHPSIARNREIYHHELLKTFIDYDLDSDDDQQAFNADMWDDHKVDVNVPNRKQIKAQSAKLLDFVTKRDEQ